jgi:hypothetical protein
MSLYTTLSVEIVGTFCRYGSEDNQTNVIIDQLNEVI